MEFGIELISFVIIIFIAALTRSTFGFGDALIAMPLLALFFSIKTATPIIAFCGFFISVVILLRNWRTLRIKLIWQLVLFSIIGIPIGIFFLKEGHETLVKTTLAIILILFSVFKLSDSKIWGLKTEKTSFIFGLISGMLGGAYNTNGPPIIIYGTMRDWSAAEFRVLLQGVFLPTNLFIIAGHGIAGLWTETVLWHFLISLPLIVPAIYLGSVLNKKINPEKFNKYLYIFLLLIAVFLLINIYF